MSESDDSSTSDEEYLPPSKLHPDASPGTGDSSASEVDEDSDDNLESRSVAEKSLDSKFENQISNLSESERKAREQAVWQDFLSSVDEPRPKESNEVITVTKKYQFAGEEVEVTEQTSVSRSSTTVSAPSIQTQPNSGTVATSTTRPPNTISKGIIPPKSGLSMTLQKLKSIGSNKTPKLTTLEKSRLDWQTFVQTENIEEDLKAHNKGKQGYLERRAFVSRTTEREYEYQRSMKARKI